MFMFDSNWKHRLFNLRKNHLQSSEMEENFVNLLNFASNTGGPPLVRFKLVQ